MVEQATLNRQILVRFQVGAQSDSTFCFHCATLSTLMQNLITLDTKLASVSGIAPKLIVKLKKLGLETVHDLLWHFPVR